MNWKKRWENELDNASGQMSERVKTTPIYNKSESAPTKKSPVKLISILSGALVAVLVLCITLSSLVTPPPANAQTFTMKINPSIAVTVQNEKVTRLTSLNADADVLISAMGSEWKNKSAQEVASMIADWAIKLGYLDADAQSKIEVKGTSDEFISSITNSVQTFFKEKGVYCAVFSETLSENSLSQYAGLDLSKTSNLGSFTYQRESVKDKNADFKALYESTLSEMEFVETLCQNIEDEIEIAYQKAEYVSDIFALNDAIMAHESNDALLFKDYWSIVKNYGADAFGVELEELLNQMSEKLVQMQSDTGLEIADYYSLIAYHSRYNLDALNANVALIREITALLDVITGEIKNSLIGALADIGASVKYLANVPTTKDEFIADCNEFISSKVHSMEKKCKEKYDKVREQISDSDYLEFLNGYPK